MIITLLLLIVINQTTQINPTTDAALTLLETAYEKSDNTTHEYTNRTLVLQTGKLREKHIKNGVDYLQKNETNLSSQINTETTLHRFLPQDIESKYEAIDFVRKFKLEKKNSFNIYNESDHCVNLGNNSSGLKTCSPDNCLLSNVNIVVSVGSTSTQAFKITKNRVIPLLPITDLNKDDIDISGNRCDPHLSLDSLSKFGGKSTNDEIAASILEFIAANANDSNCKQTNVIFVNQIGYSVLGFNPRGEDVVIPVPTKEQKVVSIMEHENFNDNGGKTGSINIFQRLAKNKNMSNLFLVTRQCKVLDPTGIELDISGQWATCIDEIKNEPSLLLDSSEVFETVIDLGGSSGTSYSRSIVNYPFDWLPIWSTEKYIRDKTFMNSETKKDFMKEKTKTPNDYVDDLEGFITQFNLEME